MASQGDYVAARGDLPLRVQVPSHRPGVPRAATTTGLATVAPPGTHLQAGPRTVAPFRTGTVSERASVVGPLGS